MVRVLEGVTGSRGRPVMIRVDNGPEFISKSLDWWAYFNEVKLDFSRPGKPTDNAYIESFNGRLRQECLNEHWFISLTDAQTKLDAWRTDYNFNRPHSALGNLTPSEFARTTASGRAQQTETVPSTFPSASADLSVTAEATVKTDGTPATVVEQEANDRPIQAGR